MSSFVATLACVILSLRIPWSIDNPKTSRLWLLPRFETLLRRCAVCSHVASMCQWGAPWKIGTGL
eukprot:4303968-Pyramimonas_sp.AAC.1